VTRLITDPTDSKTHKQDPLQKFMKLFKTSNMEIVNYCQRLFGCDLRNTLLSRRSRQRERLSASMLSICLLVCLSVCRQKTKTRFSQKPSNLEPWSPLTTYRKSYMGFSQNPLMDQGLYILIDRPGSRHRHLAIRTLYYTSSSVLL